MYGKDEYRWDGGYLYVQIIYNVSYTLALYGLGEDCSHPLLSV